MAVGGCKNLGFNIAERSMECIDYAFFVIDDKYLLLHNNFGTKGETDIID